MRDHRFRRRQHCCSCHLFVVVVRWLLVPALARHHRWRRRVLLLLLPIRRHGRRSQAVGRPDRRASHRPARAAQADRGGRHSFGGGPAERDPDPTRQVGRVLRGAAPWPTSRVAQALQGAAGRAWQASDCAVCADARSDHQTGGRSDGGRVKADFRGIITLAKTQEILDRLG